MSGALTTGTRELAAVVFVDLVGFTALTQHDERHALALLEEFRGIIRQALSQHHGLEVKTVGDAVLLRFGSALDATRFAVRAQRALTARNSRFPRAQPLQARIGIHLGEIVVAQGDLYGDVVNVASRVQHVAVPGGICVTRAVYEQLRNHWDIAVFPLKKVSLKNVHEPIELFKVEPFGKRVRTPAPATIGVTAAAALGVLGYGVLGGNLHLKPREKRPEVLQESQDAPSPPAPAANNEPTSPPPAPETSVPELIARTQAFGKRYGMPRVVRESLERLKQMPPGTAEQRGTAEAYLELLKRVSGELDREGINTETMPRRLDLMRRKLQARTREGTLDQAAMQPLIDKLQASLREGDLRAADELRKEIEARVGEP